MKRFDFSDVDLQEVFAPIEGTEFTTWASVSAAVRERRENPIPTIPTPWQKMDGEYEFTVGGYHLIGGYSGHGKSTLALQCLLHASQFHKVAIASLEMTPDAIGEVAYGLMAGASPVAKDYEKKIDEYLEHRVMYYGRIDSISPDDAIRGIIHAAAEGCRLILLDCLFMIEGVCADPEKEAAFTKTLAVVGKKYQVAIILVHHMRKPQGSEDHVPSKASFIGSSHMVNASLSCAIVWRDFDVIESRSRGIGDVDQGIPDVKFKVDKNRFFASHATYSLYEHKSRVLCETSQRKVRRVEL